MSIAFRRFGSLIALTSIAALVACGGGGGGGSSSSLPAITPTPFPSSTVAPTTPPTIGPNSVNTACFPFGGVNGMSAARSVRSIAMEPRRMPQRVGTVQYRPGMLTVRYKAGAQPAANLRTIRSYRINGELTDVVQVDEASVEQTMAQLRSQPGVAAVDRVAVRYVMSAPRDLTSDPYFAQPAQGGSTPPGAPCYESASVPGQWDMHQIGLDFAFGYSLPGNTAPGGATSNALGNPAVKIAIIDTGVDANHTDLQGKIVLQKCFITNSSIPAGTGCAGANDAVDYDGHGTNVAGIAAADINNKFGFVGAGGNVSLLIYRIFPKPPAAGCDPNATTVNPQCGANDVDEASAINDAIANGAKVINMSLGSATPSTTEQNAVNAALAAGVTVVAASGNESGTKVDYPGGYPGVVAVGATSINDSNPAQPFEYVAKYSNYDSSNSATWGIVAPGGDPTCSSNPCSDSDDLHWIENLYSTQAVVPPGQQGCSLSADFFNETNNCRTLIAGTSQATPHVAGAVGLLLSVSPNMTPAQVRAALQASAHSIGDPRQGYGRLNVYRLIGTALGDTNLPPK